MVLYSWLSQFILYAIQGLHCLFARTCLPQQLDNDHLLRDPELHYQIKGSYLYQPTSKILPSKVTQVLQYGRRSAFLEKSTHLHHNLQHHREITGVAHPACLPSRPSCRTEAVSCSASRWLVADHRMLAGWSRLTSLYDILFYHFIC